MQRNPNHQNKRPFHRRQHRSPVLIRGHLRLRAPLLPRRGRSGWVVVDGKICEISWVLVLIGSQIKSIPAKPVEGQKTGTSRLRKKVKVFQQENYLANWIQALFNSLPPEDFEDGVLVLEGRCLLFLCIQSYKLVMCDYYTPAGEPIPSNKRANATKIFSDPAIVAEETWYGIEQEYTLIQKYVNWPLGWPVGGYPGPKLKQLHEVVEGRIDGALYQ